MIIGGGPATLTSIETLRKEGFEGQIVVLCKDKHPTYDRPKLSKALDIDPEKAYLRSLDYYKKINVDFYLETVSYTSYISYISYIYCLYCFPFHRILIIAFTLLSFCLLHVRKKLSDVSLSADDVIAFPNFCGSSLFKPCVV